MILYESATFAIFGFVSSLGLRILSVACGICIEATISGAGKCCHGMLLVWHSCVPSTRAAT
jgi:hypothetical protein